MEQQAASSSTTPPKDPVKPETMPLCSRRTTLIASVTCGCIILAIGITCIVLGVKGYFTFQEPCIGVVSFDILDVDITTAEASGSNSALMSLVDRFTGGLASSIVPQQVTLTMEMVLEVNNTNPFDLEYHQDEEGLIVIPHEEGNNTFLEEDLVVGTWELPSATLQSKSRNDIPVTVTAEVDLLSGDTMGLATSVVTGQPMAFRVEGGIEGTAWVPGFHGSSTFICFARVDNILELGTGTNIRCRHITKAGKFIDQSGEINFQAMDTFEEEEDPSCWV